MDSVKEQLLILLSTPLYIAVIVGEMLLSHYRHTKSYTVKDTLTNLYLMLLNSGVDLVFRLVYLVIFQWFWEHRLYEFTTPFWYWLWLVIGMGFKPTDIIFVFAACQIWGILVHTEHVNKLGWLEYFLVTPSHHRVHHASNALYLDKNLGIFLIIWDKMFGTFQQELPEKDYQPLRYGLTKPLEKQDAFHIVFHEWIQILKDLVNQQKPLRSKFWYVFGPPGWSHDGSTLTSEQLRRKERQKKGS